MFFVLQMNRINNQYFQLIGYGLMDICTFCGEDIDLLCVGKDIDIYGIK